MSVGFGSSGQFAIGSDGTYGDYGVGGTTSTQILAALPTNISTARARAYNGRIGASTSGGHVELGLKCIGASPTQYIGMISLNDDTNGWTTFSFQGIVPVNTTALQWSSVATAGPVTWQMGNLTIRNLTREGAL